MLYHIDDVASFEVFLGNKDLFLLLSFLNGDIHAFRWEYVVVPFVSSCSVERSHVNNKLAYLQHVLGPEHGQHERYRREHILDRVQCAMEE